jgi:hypothetical protein
VNPEVDILPNDVLALERAIPSELSTGTDEELTAMLWAIRNRSRRLRLSIYRLATGPSGEFGDIVDAQGRLTGRFFSTRFAPDPSRLPLILGVLEAPDDADPIDGADNWFEPGEVAAEQAEHLPGATRTADQIRDDLRRQGAVYVTTVGRLEFYRG